MANFVAFCRSWLARLVETGGDGVSTFDLEEVLGVYDLALAVTGLARLLDATGIGVLSPSTLVTADRGRSKELVLLVTNLR